MFLYLYIILQKDTHTKSITYYVQFPYMKNVPRLIKERFNTQHEHNFYDGQKFSPVSHEALYKLLAVPP